jgi:bifunctional ADP-heptose synthase (sugar kinase/adenylyltransferase)/phosphoglycolate phosphatase-like HAD superfamily hydrolase
MSAVTGKQRDHRPVQGNKFPPPGLRPAALIVLLGRVVYSPDHSADSPWLGQLLERLPAARVAVFGNLCLDAYWLLDETPGEDSLETGRPTRRVARQRYSPGGAGNVAANLAALGVGHIEVIGQVGPDLFGDELVRQFALRGLPTHGVLRGPADWQTMVYAKPCQGAVELDRLDFGGGNCFSTDTLRPLLERLEQAAATCPVVIINQQVRTDWADLVVPALNALIARHPGTLFIVDSRHHAGAFPAAALKLNLGEAARLLDEGPDDLTTDDALRLAATLAARQNRPVMITRGEHGLVLATGEGQYDVPGIELPGAADSVGAGDAALAALAAALAAGAGPLEAAMLANHAAAITTRQLQTTGTATPAQLRALGPAPDYVHRPRLAIQPRRARYQPGTHLEIVTGRRPPARLRHAIFDHDGTLSTLRQGWEAIMEPMMLKAILGQRAADCDDATLARLTATVRAFIDRTTGIQTLAQMKGLVDLVREHGWVAPADVLDEHGYKAIFNEELLTLVQARQAQLARGDLAPVDWQIKNALPLLERLHLASGTDEADVIAEARALGYARLFTGGIHGSVGDLQVEAKRVVLERIMRTGGLGGGELVVFGDGPVEIREGRRHGAFTVGVASDEVRRHGLDLRKRTRLIRAGADIVVPDFSQLDALWSYLDLPPS